MENKEKEIKELGEVEEVTVPEVPEEEQIADAEEVVSEEAAVEEATEEVVEEAPAADAEEAPEEATEEAAVEEAAVEETLAEDAEAAETLAEDTQEEAATETLAEDAPAEETKAVATEEPEKPAMKISTAAKREKKAARRDAKAAKKAANKVEEKKSRPNNLLLAIMIFGILIIMFGAVKGYNYYKLEPSIEKYIENNGGEEAYGSMMIDQYTTASVTAEGNSVKVVMESTAEDKEVAEELKKLYGGDDWEDQMKYIGAYFLTSMKPNCRGLSADITVTSNLNKEEIKTVKLTYKEAKDYMEEQAEEAADAQKDAADTETDADAEADADSGEVEVDTDDAEVEVDDDAEAEDK